MNIGKFFAIFLSLAILASSIWTYFQQKENRKIKTVKTTNTKIRLEDYNLYRYQSDTLQTRISGSKAKVNDDGYLICEEKVKAVRNRSGIREEIEAKTAEVKFMNDALMTSKDNNVETIKLTEGVEFLRGISRFQSEDLFYTEATGEAETENPVRVDSDGQFVAAEGGMNYNIKTDAIRLKGGVFGTVRSDAMESGTKGKNKNEIR